MNISMLFGFILLALMIGVLIYTICNNPDTASDSQIEGFYPRRWWWGGQYGTRWAWRRPWMHWWGNWRPYGYYPAYSGYWKQCEPSGTWCPATMNCNSPACK
jgi:hypothetical protein